LGKVRCQQIAHLAKTNKANFCCSLLIFGV
jgi:hypothetical protein